MARETSLVAARRLRGGRGRERGGWSGRRRRLACRRLALGRRRGRSCRGGLGGRRALGASGCGLRGQRRWRRGGWLGRWLGGGGRGALDLAVGQDALVGGAGLVERGALLRRADQ